MCRGCRNWAVDAGCSRAAGSQRSIGFAGGESCSLGCCGLGRIEAAVGGSRVADRGLVDRTAVAGRRIAAVADRRVAAAGRILHRRCRNLGQT